MKIIDLRGRVIGMSFRPNCKRWRVRVRFTKHFSNYRVRREYLYVKNKSLVTFFEVRVGRRFGYFRRFGSAMKKRVGTTFGSTTAAGESERAGGGDGGGNKRAELLHCFCCCCPVRQQTTLT